jgi:hypothetical protein
MLVSVYKKIDFNSLCRSLLLLCLYRCTKILFFFLFMSNSFHRLLPVNDGEYVLMARFSYSFSMYVFTVVCVLAFRARTAGHRTYHYRRHSATGVATLMRNEGRCLTVICSVSCRTDASLILFFARKQKAVSK